METKWQEKWNYYGWKEYLDIIPERDTMQKDWNSTFVTKINLLVVQIKGLDEKAEIGVSVHPNLYETLIKHIPFNKQDGGVTYVSLRYPVNLDATLPEDKVYVYQKGVDENIGEILIDFVTETRD
jgi:hypothetical protein